MQAWQTPVALVGLTLKIWGWLEPPCELHLHAVLPYLDRPLQSCFLWHFSEHPCSSQARKGWPLLKVTSQTEHRVGPGLDSMSPALSSKQRSCAGTIPLLDKNTAQTERFCQVSDLSGTSSTDEEVSSKSGSPRKGTPLEPVCCCLEHAQKPDIESRSKMEARIFFSLACFEHLLGLHFCMSPNSPACGATRLQIGCCFGYRNLRWIPKGRVILALASLFPDKLIPFHYVHEILRAHFVLGNVSKL